MARLHLVKRARKEWKCSKCGDAIKVGEPYYWWKFLYGGKKSRCMKHPPRASDMVSSDKLSRLLAASEDLEDAASTIRDTIEHGQDSADFLDVIDTARDSLETIAESIQEVGEEYRESADSIRDAFYESETADRCEEVADECDSWYTEVQDIDFDLDFDEDWKQTLETLADCIEGVASNTPSY